MVQILLNAPLDVLSLIGLSFFVKLGNTYLPVPVNCCIFLVSLLITWFTNESINSVFVFKINISLKVLDPMIIDWIVMFINEVKSANYWYFLDFVSFLLIVYWWRRRESNRSLIAPILSRFSCSINWWYAIWYASLGLCIKI